MIDLYGVLQEQETINGELGLGVDYYKGKKGDTPIKGVDYLTPDDVKEISDKVLEKVEAGTKGEDGKSAYQIALDEGFEGSETEWLASLKGADGRNGIDGKTPVKGVDYFTQAEIQQIENNAAAKVDLSDYTKSADLSSVATSGSYNDLKDKPSIPAAYELPVASATALGGVKVGSGLSITDGVLSATGGGTADSVDWSKIQNKPDFADVATSGSYNDLADKPTIPSTTGLATETYVDDKIAEIDIPIVPTKVSAFTNDAGYLTEHQSLIEYAKKTDIPAPYTLPTASTSTLGGVKVDGNTITIADGVISSVGGSGCSEPEKYIKDASVSGNTLTLTKKDDTEVVFTPSGGSSDIKSYSFSTGSLTTEEIANLQYCVDNPTKVIFTIDNIKIQNAYKQGTQWFFIGIFCNGDSRLSTYYIKTAENSTTIIGTSLSKQYSYNAIITQSNIDSYLSSWHVAESLENTGLYNARELAILFENNETNVYYSSYYNFSCSFDSIWDSGGLGMYANKNFYIKISDNEYSNWYYDGSSIHLSGSITNYRIFYKT